MKETWDVQFCDRAADALREMAASDPAAYAAVKGQLEIAQEHGWAECMQLRIIRKIKGARDIYEVRAMSLGLRLIFFMIGPGQRRQIVITAFAPKPSLKPRRLLSLARAAEKARGRWQTLGTC